MRELDSSKELLELSRRDPLGFLDGGNVHKKPRARKENEAICQHANARSCWLYFKRASFM